MDTPERCYVPKRYIFTLLSFLGLFNVYAMRVNLSVAMVAMVNSTEAKAANKTAEVVECAMLLKPQNDSSRTMFKGEQYNWNKAQQSMILGAFFYGYIFTQIPGGFLSERLGAKWLLGGGVLITSVLTLLTPFAASHGTAAFVVVRILEGFGEGVTFPAMNFIVSQWSPVLERSRISSIIHVGAQIGNVVSMPVSGWLSSTDLFGGWPSAFYLFGAVGCIWFVIWTFFIYDSPATHPTISMAELAYIQESPGNEPKKKRPVFPWRAIFTSMPFWATLVSSVTGTLGFSLFLTELPTYLSSILHYDIQEGGALSALPYISQALVALMGAFVADKLRASGRLSITSIRKIMNTIGFVSPGVCLLVVTGFGCRPQLTVGLLTLALALNGVASSGYHVTHIDMCPEFSGTLFGITNCVSNLCGIIAPILVGAFTSSGSTISNWNKVFYITAASYAVGALVFLIFASAERQPWIPEEPIKDPCTKPTADRQQSRR